MAGKGVLTQTQTLWFVVSNCDGPLSAKPNIDLTSKPQFTLLPNPASDIVAISIPNEYNNAVFDAELYNSLGQMILKKRIINSDNRLEIAALSKGVYNLILRNPTDKKTIYSNKLSKF